MSDKKEESIVLSKSAIKRIVSDVKDLIKSPLVDQGIYYHHDEDDILKGYALITGPKDSLYYGGYYMFTFSFPKDYPHSPPVAYYHTNDGETRFHPNMYKSGKVCLSILNTWRGEPWSGCQTIRSVLLTILSVFDDKPFLHEPGITEVHPCYDLYHDIIHFRNLSFSCFIGVDVPNTKRDPKEKFNGFPVYLFHDEINRIHSLVIDDLVKMVTDKIDVATLSHILKIEEKVKSQENNTESSDPTEPYDINQHNKSVFLSAYRINCCFNWYKLILKFRDEFGIKLDHLVCNISNVTKSSHTHIEPSAPTKKTKKVKPKSKVIADADDVVLEDLESKK